MPPSIHTRLTIATDVGLGLAAAASKRRWHSDFRSQRSCQIRTHFHTQDRANRPHQGHPRQGRRPPVCPLTAATRSCARRRHLNAEQGRFDSSSWRKARYSRLPSSAPLKRPLTSPPVYTPDVQNGRFSTKGARACIWCGIGVAVCLASGSPARLKRSLFSRKNWRRSGKRNSNRVRLITCWSTSTCEKSGL